MNKQKKSLSKAAKLQKIRFVIVGLVNTGVDFSILFLLIALFSLPAVVANMGSTIIALAVSYALNKRAVFGDNSAKSIRQIVTFVTITLFGLWVLQGIVIMGLPTLLWMFYGVGDGTALFIAKLIAIAVSLVWNYLWYSRVIFKPTNSQE